MRRSEILGLSWDAVDLKAGRLAVVQTLVLVNHRPTVKDKPKTDSSWRSVALDPTTVGVLREWRKTQLEERLVWTSAWQENGLTFTREDGSPINPERFSRWFGSRVRAADVPRISLKELRHTHASLALEAGVHPKVVQERLGHSSISVTLDTYSHAIPAMQEAAAEQVAGLVFGT